jgi:triosephosphate isomerase
MLSHLIPIIGSMKKLIIANWKLNPQTYKEAKTLVESFFKAKKQFKNVELVICPPFVWLTDLSRAYARYFGFGAQDVFWKQKGAFTGEISPRMLKSSRVTYVIVGHSERRKHLGETDEMIRKKVVASLEQGLKVVLCIGESLREKKTNATKAVLRRQLRAALKGVRPILRQAGQLVIAYEPVWAIGSGTPETPYSANLAASLIRDEVLRLFPDRLAKNIRIVYGGSVNSSNIFGYLMMKEITGALVGGDSLNPSDFRKILEITDLV